MSNSSFKTISEVEDELLRSPDLTDSNMSNEDTPVSTEASGLVVEGAPITTAPSNTEDTTFHLAEASFTLPEDIAPRVTGPDVPPPLPHNEASHAVYVHWLLGRGLTHVEAFQQANLARRARDEMLASPVMVPFSVFQGNISPPEGSFGPLAGRVGEPGTSKPPETPRSSKEEDTKAKPNKTNPGEAKKRTLSLCGSQKKRYLHFIRKGLNHEQALQASAKPIQDNTDLRPIDRKRQRSSTGTTPESQKGGDFKRKPDPRSKLPHNQESKKPPHRPVSFRDAIQGVRVGIVHADYPRTLLTDEQLDRVQNDIMVSTLSAAAAGYRPAFTSLVYRTGWLLLHCKNRGTADWLRTIIPVGGSLGDIPLRIIEGDDLPRHRIAVGYFPNSSNLSSELILEHLFNQNTGLNTDHWRVLQRSEEGNISLLTVSVDEASASAIEAENHRVNFRWGTISLRLRKAGGTQTATGAGMEVDPAAEPAQDATLPRARDMELQSPPVPPDSEPVPAPERLTDPPSDQRPSGLTSEQRPSSLPSTGGTSIIVNPPRRQEQQSGDRHRPTSQGRRRGRSSTERGHSRGSEPHTVDTRTFRPPSSQQQGRGGRSSYHRPRPNKRSGRRGQ